MESHSPLEVAGATLTTTQIVAPELSLTGSAVLTTFPTTETEVHELELEIAGTLLVDATSKIDVTGKGYLPGRTTGNTTVGGATGASGGSFGGRGGTYTGQPATVYGDYADPDDWGSGGTGTRGGGLVRIQSLALMLDGRILADGVDGRGQGTGAGGGVFISTGTLSGTGQVRADGGDAEDTVGGGGGGRIAVYAQDFTGFDATKIKAFGGSGGNSGGSSGGAGTVYFRDTDEAFGTLIIDSTEGSGTTPLGLPGQTTFSIPDAVVIRGPGANVRAEHSGLTLEFQNTLTVENSAKMYVSGMEFVPQAAVTVSSSGVLDIAGSTTVTVPLNITNSGRLQVPDGFTSTVSQTVAGGVIAGGKIVAPSLSVINSGILTALDPTTSAVHKLELEIAGTLLVDATSRIDVSGKGYLGTGHSAPAYTTGNTTVGGATGGSGGSHGGRGGGPSPSVVYDNYAYPDDWGSGGSGVGPFAGGGTGGGLVQIHSGTFSLEGDLLADGTNGGASSGPAGGGAGGGILVVTDALNGAGIIRARGGNAAHGNANGGGGGRIAVYASDLSPLEVNRISTPGGNGGGGTGTVYLRDTDEPHGTLYIQAVERYAPSGITPLGLPEDTTFSIPDAVVIRSHADSGITVVPEHAGLVLEFQNNLTIEVGGVLSAPAAQFVPQGPVVATTGGVLRLSGDFTPTLPLTLSESGILDVIGDLNLNVPVTLTSGGRLQVSDTLTSSLPLTVDGGEIAGGKIIAPSLSVINSGMLTALNPSTSAVHKLELEIAGTLLVDASSGIDVSRKGYPQGRTQGNTPDGAATLGAGGSYGGLGGVPSGMTNKTYGDYADPDEWGSGSTLQPGGGLVRIHAERLELAGEILSDGGGGFGPGGSGGSIYVAVTTLTGAGSMRAQGGSGVGDGGAGGGGGGRVAVYAQDFTDFNQAAITAPGNFGRVAGGAGTVHITQGRFPTRVRSHLPMGLNGGYEADAISSITLEFSRLLDLSTFEPADLMVTGQMGPINATTMVHVDNRTYRIDLQSALTENGFYHFQLAPTLHDTEGVQLDQNANAIPGEDDDGYEFNLYVDTIAPLVTSHSPAGDIAGTVDFIDVTFSETIDKSSFTPPHVEIIKPNSQTVPVSSIDEVGRNRFRLHFEPQTLVGMYHFSVGPDVRDLAGNQLDQNHDGSPGQSPQDTYEATFNIAPTDLQLSQLLVGATTLWAGEDVSISWRGRNDSGAAIQGTWVDGVYLSVDSQWDFTDRLLTTVVHEGGLAKGQEYSQKVAIPMIGRLPGSYHIVVRSDIYNQEKEADNETNNAIVSDEIPLMVRPLAANGTTVDGLLRDSDRADYYAIRIAEGQHLEIALNSPDNTGPTDLYVRFGQVPTRSQFDYRGSAFGSDGRVARVSYTLPGTYYVMVYGNQVPGDGRPYTLSATLPGMTLLAVSPESVGNSGPVTIRFQGAALPISGVAPLLISPAGAPYPAISTYQDETDVIYATFDLTGAEVGGYDARLDMAGVAAVELLDVLDVHAGIGAKLWFNVTSPAGFFIGHEINDYITIEYANLGDADMPAPLLVLSEPNDTEFNFNGRSIGDGQLQLLGVAPDGPAGILRLGARNQIRVVPQRGARVVEYTLTARDEETGDVPWDTVKELLRPDYISAADWESVWPLFIAAVGATWAEYHETLARNATLISDAAGNATDPFDLLALEIDRAYAETGPSIRGRLAGSDPGLLLADRHVVANNLADGSEYTSISLTDGTFIFPRVTSGQYSFSVAGSLVPTAFPVDLGDGQSLKDLVISVEKGGSFAGIVLAHETGSPISDALVVAVGANGTRFEALSGPDGRYHITGLPTDLHLLTVDVPGRARSIVPDVAVGQATVIQDFYLEREASVAGKVTLQPGGPTDGRLRVTARSSDTDGRLSLFFGAVTDAEFSVGFLPASTYTFEIARDGYLSRTFSNVTLEMGQTLDLGTVNLELDASVSGNVISDNPRIPAAGALVGVFSGPTQVGSALADGNGDFVVDQLAAGHFTLRVLAVDDDSLSPAVPLSLTAGQSISDVSLSVLEGATIHGTVLRSDSLIPIARTAVTVTSPSGRTLVTTTNEDGVYRIEGVGPGEQRVAINVPGVGTSQSVEVLDADGGEYEVTLTFESVAVISGRLILADGTAPSNGRVDLYVGESQVTTAVADQYGNYWFELAREGTFGLQAYADDATFSPITGIRVLSGAPTTIDMTAGTGALTVQVTAPSGPFTGGAYLYRPTSSYRDLVATAVIPADGIVGFTNLAPGPYTVETTDSNRGAQETVSIVSDEVANISISLEPRLIVSGTVYDDDGNVIAGGTLIAINGDGSGRRSTTVSDLTGTYSINGLISATYDLVAIVPGFETAIRDGIVVDDHSSVDFALTPAIAQLSGRAVDPNGNGIPNASVVISDSNGTILGFASTIADGTFVIDVPIGTGLTLQVSTGGCEVIESVDISTVAGVTNIGDLVVDPVALASAASIVTPPGDNPAAVAQAQRTVNGSASDDLTTLNGFGDPLTAAAAWLTKYIFGFSRRSDEVHGKYDPILVPIDCGMQIKCKAAAESVNRAIKVQDEAFGRAQAAKFNLDYAVFAGALEFGAGLLRSSGAIAEVVGAAVAVGGEAAAAGVGLRVAYLLTDVVDTVYGEIWPLFQKALQDTEDGEVLTDIGFLSSFGSTAFTTTAEVIGILESDPLHIEKYAKAAGWISLLKIAIGFRDRYFEGVAAMADAIGAIRAANSAFQGAKRQYDNAVERAKQALANYIRCVNGADDKLPRFSDSGAGGKKAKTEILCAYDPNDKVGPNGFGQPRFIDSESTLSYDVLFENDPELATAPAQTIRITDTLDTNLDLSSLQFHTIAFANHVMDIPPGLNNYNGSVDLRPDGINAIVQIDAELELPSRIVTVTLKAIDPYTGTTPDDGGVGLLYPNDATHRGEGLFRFSVRAKTDLPSGTQIVNRAHIFFDLNAPIDTPLVRNTLDADPPASHVLPLAGINVSRIIEVEWSGQDELGGSGIASYDIYVAIDDGAPFLWLTDTTALSGQFEGLPGHTYAFFSTARDNVGHEENSPPEPDAVTMIRSLGDMNFDGNINMDDIADLVLGLNDPATYEAAFGMPAPLHGDVDGDGDLDFDDIDDFVLLLEPSAGGQALSALAGALTGSGLPLTAPAGNHACGADGTDAGSTSSTIVQASTPMKTSVSSRQKERRVAKDAELLKNTGGHQDANEQVGQADVDWLSTHSIGRLR